MGIKKIVSRTYRDHKDRWKDCNACELCGVRRKVVLYRGDLPCDILFIAESPGISEDTLGNVLIGPAGKLLDSLIDVAKQDQELKIGFTNLIACIPKEITEEIFCTKCGEKIPSEDLEEKSEDCPYCKTRTLISRHLVGKKISEPTPIHIKACAERLEEIYTMARPKKVVLVGRLSERWVPKVLDVAVEDTIGITHPAAILRASIANKGLMAQRVRVQLEDLFDELVEEKEKIR